MTSELHPFDQAIALEPLAEGRWRGQTHAAYANIAGPFGGAIAAVLLNAVMLDARRLSDPVALTVNFCGAVADGGYEIAARVARGGRTTQHWLLELTQNDTVCATASIVCGQRKAVWSHQQGTAPQAPPRETLTPMPHGMSQGWTHRYAFHFADGSLSDFPRGDGIIRSARSLVYLQDHPPRPLDFPALASISDAFFVRIMHARGTLQPMATITLTTYFHLRADELAALGAVPLLGEADAATFHGGFADQTVALWTPGGKLAANGVQLTWYRA